MASVQEILALSKYMNQYRQPDIYQRISQMAQGITEGMRQREVKSRLDKYIREDRVTPEFEIDPATGRYNVTYKTKEEREYPYTREEKIEFEGIKNPPEPKSNIQRIIDGEMPMPKGYQIGYGKEGKPILEKIEKKKVPTLWDIQKEARANINAMITSNPTLQMELMRNPRKRIQMLNDEVKRLSEQYGLTSNIARSNLDEMVIIRNKKGETRPMTRREAIEKGYVK